MGPSPRTSVGHVKEPYTKRCCAHQHPCRRLRRRLKVTAGLTLCPKLTIRTGRSVCLLAVWLAASGLPLTNIVIDRLQDRRPYPLEIDLGVSRRRSGLAPAWLRPGSGLAPMVKTPSPSSFPPPSSPSSFPPSSPPSKEENARHNCRNSCMHRQQGAS